MITPEVWARMQPVLDQALELPPAMREAYLSEACDDPALRREVERVLRSSELGRDSILERSVVELAPPLLDAPGQVVLDRYELIRPLGSGGMGTVYLARDRTLGRTVALKFLPSSVAADPEAILRFRNEARAASALDHPNIATVHDTAQAEDGRPFIVMGFYEGETLRRRLERGPLPVSDAQAIAIQVAQGLAAAHAAGIVHRDIKPSNVLVAPDGRVRILDFGIAKTAGQTVTGPSARPGTVAYMSPEQTRPGEVDRRTDLWSLGVVLYEALTGRRPFAADDDNALINAIRHDQPPPIRQLRPEVPEALARIVERCLGKHPDHRFPDAESLVRALRAAGARERISQEAWIRRGRPFARLRRHPAALVLAAVAVAGLALGYTAVRDRVARSGQRGVAAPSASGAPVRIAVLPFGVLGDQRFAYLEQGMIDLFSTQLDGAGPLRSVDPRALLAFLRPGAGSPPDGQAVARRFDAALFLSGNVVEAGGRLMIRATLYDAQGRLQAAASSEAGDESRLFELVDQVARQLIGSRYGRRGERLTRLAAATTSSLPALKAYLEGERALREGHFDDALARFRQAVDQDSAFALAWYRLAVAAEWTVRPTVAGAAAERAHRLATTLPEHDRLLVSGWHAYANGDAAQAERDYRRVLDDYPDDVEAWTQLGEVLFHNGPLDGRPLALARSPFERALSLEPTHEGALLHLARIAAREGALPELNRVVDRLVAAHPRSEIAVEARALRAFAARDQAAAREVIQEYRRLGSDAVFTGVWTASYTGDPAAVAALAHLLTDDRRPGDVRAAGHLLLATAELSRGRPRSTRRALAQAAALNPAWALELGTIWAVSGIMPGKWGLDSLRLALDRWDPAGTAPSQAPSAFLSAHDGAHRLLKTYLIGLVDTWRGETGAAALSAANLERVAAVDTTLAVRLARGLRAEALSRAGRSRDALAVLETPGRHSAYALAVASPFHAGVRERFFRAQLLAQLDREQEALNWYASLGTGSVYDLPYVAPAHLRAAAVLEARGEAAEAAEHYRRVVELWRDAEPELRDSVEEARRRAEAGASQLAR
ncbi:MAG TPA: protein kinase [Gemmatimonadales bacterium]|nr:protein kinase [Gemmatimonadales bacterium]